MKYRKNNILHIGPLPPPIGGMAFNVQRYLLSDVAKAFNIVHVKSDLIGKTRYTGLLRTIMNLTNAVLLTITLISRIVWNRPVLVHIRTNSFGGFYEKSALSVIARFLGRRVMIHIHGGAFGVFHANSSRLGKWFIRKLLGVNHRVIVLSEQMRETLLNIGLPKDRIRIIENAVFLPDESIWNHASNEGQPTRHDTNKITVIFLNRIDVQKGILELVDAARNVCENNSQVQCLIYGPDTPDAKTIRDRIHDMKMSEQIRLSGPVVDQEKENAYLSADIYVLPSYIEGMPIGLLEAASYGLPCIVSAVGGVPAVIEDGVNGLLIEPRDVDGLRNAMKKLIDDPALRRELGTRARRTIETRFSWDQSAKEIVRIYNELIFGKGVKEER